MSSQFHAEAAALGVVNLMKPGPIRKGWVPTYICYPRKGGRNINLLM